MNNPNPLVPQGSLLEQKGKGKPHLRIAIFIVAIHVVFLGGLLMQGCKREPAATTASLAPTNDFSLPPLDTNVTGVAAPADTNLPPLQPGGGAGAGGLAGITPPVTDPFPSTAVPPTAQPPGGVMEAPAPAPTGTTPYVIRKGDTLGAIAKRHKITLRALTEANPTVDPAKLKLGQTIHLPVSPEAAASAGGAAGSGMGAGAGAAAAAPGVVNYVVKSGDTLTRIAKAHGTTLKELRTLNKLKTDRINVGQKLKVPAKAPAMSAEAVPGAGLPVPAVGGVGGVDPTAGGGVVGGGAAQPLPLGGLQPIPAAGAPATSAPPR